MASKRQYTAYQEGLINRYYQNIDAIMLQKLQELVTELYLAESQAARDRLWDRVQKAMTKLKVPPSIAQHIMASRSVEALASNVQDWLKQAR